MFRSHLEKPDGFLHLRKKLILTLEEELSSLKKNPKEIFRQLDLLKRGFQPAQLHAPCTTQSGILSLSDERIEELLNLFNVKQENFRFIKFVPASGAASRMFKHLRNPNPDDELVIQFKENIDRFAFFEDLKESIGKDPSGSDVNELSEALLEKLNYGNLPKGSILFHRYEDENRTAFQEQIQESCSLFDDPDIHFTLGEGFFDIVQDELSDYASNQLASKKVTLSYSVQHPETDTVALSSSGELYRKANGEILFRPGGHGALVHNLNDLNADVIVIKNIDNIVTVAGHENSNKYKKCLLGLGIEIKTLIDEVLSDYDSTGEIDSEKKKALESVLGIHTRNGSSFIQSLNRPLRICGMVKNTGEPGGGPFWVKNQEGSVSKQIVEKAQIDLSDPTQKEIFLKSTHFNPVDLVCFVNDHDGKKFDLLQFVDPEASFIAQKSFEGEDITVLEHPGLWNGAMAGWNTVFVEVPLSTFNPVKTVNDLLRPMHQA